MIYDFKKGEFMLDPDITTDQRRDSKTSSQQEDPSDNKEDNGADGELAEPPKEDDKVKKPAESEDLKVVATNSGITGIVFKTKELYFSNTPSIEKHLVVATDNRTTCTTLKNFMIAPVFTSEEPASPMNSETPCAIMQFINKVDKAGKVSSINELDFENFESMQKLLGICIENTNELSETATTQLSLEFKDNMKRVQRRIEAASKVEDHEADMFINEFTERLSLIN